MSESTAIPALSGSAFIVFGTFWLQRLSDTAHHLGFHAQAFNDAEEALDYIEHSETSVNVVIANGAMTGLLNGSDLATRLSEAYPSLPLVVTDHFDGLVANNVMCLDSPWTSEDIEEKVQLMVTLLLEGKLPSA
jgi:hypothetical protein